MTSTPNPQPNFPSLPGNNHQNLTHQNNKNSDNNSHKNRRQYSTSRAAQLVVTYPSILGYVLGGRKSRNAPVFSRGRSIWFDAKGNYGMPRVELIRHVHSPAAGEALCFLKKAGNDNDIIESYLIAYESHLGMDDYVYMLKELCNSGNILLAITCFDFLMMKKNGRVARGKLTSTMIDTLGKLGETNLALRLFETARLEGYGNTIHSFLAMITAYARKGCFHDAINLFRSMSSWGLEPNLITYNSLIEAGSKWDIDFNEVIDTWKEMEKSGIKIDVVSYNVLLSAYDKHGMYDEAIKLFEEMKARNIYLNKLTYSIMIGLYTKGRMFQEAMKVYKEFKMALLEADVVFYSAIIVALCKIGSVKSSIILLVSMIEKGIKPNIFTFNSIAEASRQSSSMLVDSSTFQSQKCDDCILKMFEKLAVEREGNTKNDGKGRHDQNYILWLLQKLHEMHVEPNVATFSAILNACSRCYSLEDATKLIDALDLFNNHMYDVIHGLLMGYRERVWSQAQNIFDELRRINSSTTTAFYNSLVDMLWHFGQKLEAQMVVIEGRGRNVWKGKWSISCLDLNLMSCGAACAMVHVWLLYMHNTLFKGTKLPKIVRILTGWGKRNKVMGDETLKRAIEVLLNAMGSPFKISKSNLGKFVSPGDSLATWLRQPGVFDVIVQCDFLNHSQAANPSRNHPDLGY